MAVPYTSVIPDAHVYGQQANLANQAYSNAMARIGQQRSDALLKYGYEADFDAAGNMSNLRIAANSPYGAVQQMFRNQARRAGQVEQAQRGRGFAGLRGLAQRELDDDTFEMGRERSDLGQEFQGNISNFRDQITQATEAKNNALWQAEQEAMQAAIQQRQFSEAQHADTGFDQYDEPLMPASAATAAIQPKQQKSVIGMGANSKILRNGAYLNKAQWKAYLSKQGPGALQQWVRNHPAAARQMGF